MARYFERGGNFLDTANGYTGGHSERIIGNFIAHDRTRRDEIVIATKFFSNQSRRNPNGGGASRKAVIASCEQSLRRLRTDYIDLYWMHVWDRFTPIEETMRALDDLVRAGKVRYIGFSDTPAWKVAQAQTTGLFRGWTPLVALQIEYSLLERTVEGELMPMAAEMGLGVTPWSPIAGGVLSGKFRREDANTAASDRGVRVLARLTERTFTILDEVKRVAAALGTTPAAVALAWVQARPGVVSTIIGARRLDQLDANLAALDLRLSPEHVQALDAVSAPVLGFPMTFLGGAVNFMHNGLTVNGVPSQAMDLLQPSPHSLD